MKIGLLTALAAAGVAMALSTAAWAQSLPLPQGSYRNSCTNARAMQLPGGGRLLTAQCRTSNGSTRNTSLRFENCRGDISNNNGNLTCSNLGGGVGGARPPSGSYQQTCRDARMQGSTLSASCRDNRNRWQSSSINTNNCRGRDIANINGRLTCSGGGGGGGGGAGQIPSGSFQSTCRNAFMNGFTLTAQCRLTFGSQTRTSSIDTRTCGGRDIYNLNGVLRCDGQGGGGGGGRGGITLFTQRDFNGRSADINGAAAGLGQWSIADQALSVRVRSGRWQLCTDTNFRGRCIDVSRDERDLSRLGMGNNISSVRPR